MKNSRKILFLALAALSFTGCDGTAREYAASLNSLLDSMRTQATTKLMDEQSRYQTFAHRLRVNADRDMLSNLRIDRTSDSAAAVTQQLLDGKMRGGEVIASLREYAEKDFTATQGIFGSRPDEELNAIKDLRDLSLEKAKLDALHEALAGLAKNQSLLETASQMKEFGEQVKGNLDFHHCEDLDSKAQEAAAKIAALRAKLAAAPAADKPAIQSDLDAAQGSQKALEAQRAATGRFDATGNKCTRPAETTTP